MDPKIRTDTLKSSILRVAASLLLVVFSGCGDSVGPDELLGLWGGTGMGIEVSVVDATVDFDCATETIDVPFILEGGGSFTAEGTWTMGEPVQSQDDPPKPQPATYSGQVRSNRMTIGLIVRSTGVVIGPNTLIKGQTPVLRRCL